MLKKKISKNFCVPMYILRLLALKFKILENFRYFDKKKKKSLNYFQNSGKHFLIVKCCDKIGFVGNLISKTSNSIAKKKKIDSNKNV